MRSTGTYAVIDAPIRTNYKDKKAAIRPHLRLKVQPHVALRLKRVFPRVDQYAREHIDLLLTDETARELEWFMQMYPLEPLGDAQTLLGAAARRHDAKLQLIEDIGAGEYVPPAVRLAIPPRQYQLVPAHVVVTSGSLLLGDDVGIGKTASAIVLAATPGTLPIFFVTKTELPKQVQAEFNRFAPDLKTHVVRHGKSHKGDKPLDLARRLSHGERFPDVVILSYSKLDGWANFLAPYVRSLVFDEIQELRNGTSTARGAAADLLAQRAAYRLGLSATPIYNHGGEMHAVLEFLAPGALGSYEEFQREWAGGYKGAVKDPAALGTYLRQRGLYLRRTRADVGRELPPLSIIEQIVDHDANELGAIEQEAAALANFILNGRELVRGQKMSAGGDLDWKLRHATGVAKAPYVAAFVRLLVESGEKVLLYGWHHDCYNLWADRLKDLQPVFYTGRETVAQRAAAKQKFVYGESPVLIMSLRSGAGLDGLQHVPSARTVVFGELDWSPGVHEQAIGRLYRDGIGDPVAAYFLVAEDGSDPIVAEALGLKKAQITGLRDPNAPEVALPMESDRSRTLAENYLRQRKLLSQISAADLRRAEVA